jgi:uncharacterized protein (TIGR03086 family)
MRGAGIPSQEGQPVSLRQDVWMPGLNDIAKRHLRACDRFGEAVAASAGKWNRSSPCDDWDARGVLEHVIGFHDVLLLRPMNEKPERPRDDPLRRWLVTKNAIQTLLIRPGFFDGPIDVPAVGNNPAIQLDAAPLVAALTQDVLVHTWDLARAVGADERLDPDLCEHYLRRLPEDPQGLVRSGMFGPAVHVETDEGPQSQLLARLGRSPDWQPPSHP